MDNEKNPKEAEIEQPKKRPRGRPRKEEKKNEPMTEPITELKMAQTEKPVTLGEVTESLTSLYNKTYQFSNRGVNGGWMEALGSLNEHNPFLQNQRLKRIAAQPMQLSSEEIAAFLSNPQNNELPLQSGGWGLSVSQYLYYKILRLACDVPMYNHYKIPLLLEDESGYSKKDFKKEDAFVDEWIEKFSPKNTFKRIALEVKREGKSSYLLRNSITVEENGEKHTNFATMQKLPTAYTKLTAIGEYGYIASFNFMIFMDPAFDLNQYPDYFKDIWCDMVNCGAVYRDNVGRWKADVDKLLTFEYDSGDGILRKGVFESKKNKYLFWVQLPQKLCYTFASDMSHPWAVPDTVGLFQNLQDLADYNTLAGLVQSTPLTAILTGEVEIVDDPNPGADQTVIAPQTIAGFQNDFNSKTSTNVEALFVPFKNLKLQSLPNIPNSSDIVTKAVQNFVSMSGEGGIIVATDKPSVAMIKGAQKLEESQQNYVTLQFERVMNMIINELLGCKYKWRFFLWGGIYTYEDEMARMKEMWQNGATFLLPRIASGYGLTTRDVTSVSSYIESFDMYKNFKTLTQQSQQEAALKNAKASAALRVSTGSSSVTTKTSEKTATSGSGAGRPAKSDGEIENDNTAASRDSGGNTSENKGDYSFAFNGKCILCGVEVEEGEFLCEECKEEYKQTLEEEGVV